MPTRTNLYKYQTTSGILIDRHGGTDDECEFTDTEDNNNHDDDSVSVHYNNGYGSGSDIDESEMIDYIETLYTYHPCQG